MNEFVLAGRWVMLNHFSDRPGYYKDVRLVKGSFLRFGEGTGGANVCLVIRHVCVKAVLISLVPIICGSLGDRAWHRVESGDHHWGFGRV